MKHNAEITVITMTANRPKDLARLQKYMGRQTYKNFKWLVIKDSDVAYPEPMPFETRIQRVKKENELHSMLENLREGLLRVDTPLVAICEDDDWFSPDYLEKMVAMLKDHHLAGFSQEIVYRASNRTFSRAWNVAHASLSATGWQHEEITPFVLAIIEQNDVYVDSILWQEIQEMEGYSAKLTENTERESRGLLYHVGFKSDHGASPLHTRQLMSEDTIGGCLRKWIGEDAQEYL